MKGFPLRARYLIFTTSFLSISALVFADSYPSKPKDVLAKYLELDSEAAGLSTSTWPELGAYTTWTQAPTWDTFMVIQRYEIGKVLTGSTRAQVNVTYYPLGKLTSTFEANTQPETVYYHLNKVAGVWRVDTPELIPHVAWPVMRKRLEAASAKDAAAKKSNGALISQINAVAANLK